MILKNTCAAAVLFIASLCASSAAYANKTVDAPYAEGGAAYLEWKGGYDIDEESDIDGGWVQEGNVGYGITDYWNLEVGTAYEHEGISDGDTDFTALTIENRFNLLPQGKYFIDFGISGAYSFGLQDDAPDGIEAKLLFAKDIGQFTNLANIIIGREVGEDSSDDTNYGFAWATSYAINDNFAAGLEWFSDVGDFAGDFDEQSHQVGPAVYGSFGEGFGYEAGALFGVSDGAQDAQIKAVINYSFPINK